MPLPAVLHPDVVDFLHTHTQNYLKDKVWKCIEKLRYQAFDSGLRVKKLKGMPKRVWEARISQASRLIFTYDSSRQPDTGDARVYIAVQDICLEHDDVSRRVKARKRTPDAQWLDAEEIEVMGSLNSDLSTLNHTEKNALLTLQIEDSQISDDFVDELLSNIQWQVVESESEWQKAIIVKDADLRLKLTPEEYQLVKEPGNFLLSGSAGTGKTTVGLYRLLENLENLPIQKRLYIAYNPILVKDSQKQFKRLIGINDSALNSSFHFKSIRELCLEILKKAGLSYFEYDEVDYKVFEQFYYRRECKRSRASNYY